MSDIARRVIKVTPDQVIGAPRRKRKQPRERLYGDPRNDPMYASNWVTPDFGTLRPTWGNPENEPTQQGFGHFDKIARRLKR